MGFYKNTIHMDKRVFMAIRDDTREESFAFPKETPKRFEKNDEDINEIEFVDFQGKRVKRVYKKDEVIK